jgi:prepilin-type N-terminal cleavage/methylation domain-containing protein
MFMKKDMVINFSLQSKQVNGYNTKGAFTLAEVLIVLVIIGIIAMLTIIPLKNNTDNLEFRTAFKKAVSAMNQIINMNIAQNSTDTNSTSSYGGSTKSAQLMNYFSQNMRILSSDTTNNRFTTADGIIYQFFGTGDCAAAGSDLTNGTPCYALVDVNGAKKPNKMWNDEYYVALMKTVAVPTTYDFAAAAKAAEAALEAAAKAAEEAAAKAAAAALAEAQATEAAAQAAAAAAAKAAAEAAAAAAKVAAAEAAAQAAAAAKAQACSTAATELAADKSACTAETNACGSSCSSGCSSYCSGKTSCSCNCTCGGGSQCTSYEAALTSYNNSGCN